MVTARRRWQSPENESLSGSRHHTTPLIRLLTHDEQDGDAQVEDCGLPAREADDELGLARVALPALEPPHGEPAQDEVDDHRERGARNAENCVALRAVGVRGRVGAGQGGASHAATPARLTNPVREVDREVR